MSICVVGKKAVMAALTDGVAACLILRLAGVSKKRYYGANAAVCAACMDVVVTALAVASLARMVIGTGTSGSVEEQKQEEDEVEDGRLWGDELMIGGWMMLGVL
jgi:sugar (pentulose or hexulose) kinase